MSLVSWLYQLARKANDVSTVTSGKPKRMAKRVKNKVVGRTIGSKLFKFPF